MVPVSSALLILYLIAASVSDLHSRRIPKAMLGAMVGCWLLLGGIALLIDQANSIVLGARLAEALVLGGVLFAITVAFERMTGAFAMGGGDIKLVACITLFIGFEAACVGLLIACALAVLTNLAQRIAVVVRPLLAQASSDGVPPASKATLGTFPFAPFLACGTCALLLL